MVKKADCKYVQHWRVFHLLSSILMIEENLSPIINIDDVRKIHPLPSIFMIGEKVCGFIRREK